MKMQTVSEVLEASFLTHPLCYYCGEHFKRQFLTKDHMKWITDESETTKLIITCPECLKKKRGMQLKFNFKEKKPI